MYSMGKFRVQPVCQGKVITLFNYLRKQTCPWKTLIYHKKCDFSEICLHSIPYKIKLVSCNGIISFIICESWNTWPVVIVRTNFVVFSIERTWPCLTVPFTFLIRTYRLQHPGFSCQHPKYWQNKSRNCLLVKEYHCHDPFKYTSAAFEQLWAVVGRESKDGVGLSGLPSVGVWNLKWPKHWPSNSLMTCPIPHHGYSWCCWGC